MTWAAILATAVGCYAEKLAGWSLPRRVLEAPRLQRAAALLPLALLAALVVVQTVGDGRSLSLDVRAAGVAAGAVAAAFRAPFLVIVVVAAATAALLRAL
jgi:uncharacterized membrane protein